MGAVPSYKALATSENGCARCTCCLFSAWNKVVWHNLRYRLIGPIAFASCGFDDRLRVCWHEVNIMAVKLLY